MDHVLLKNIPTQVQEKYGVGPVVEARFVESKKTKTGKCFRTGTVEIDPDDIRGMGVNVEKRPPRIVS